MRTEEHENSIFEDGIITADLENHRRHKKLRIGLKFVKS